MNHWILNLLLVALLMPIGCGGGGGAAASAGVRAGESELPLESHLVRMFGALDGPWQLDKVASPRIVLLKPKAGGEAQPFVLLGLRAGDYPAPAGAEAPTAARREELTRLAEYKMARLGELIGERPLYLVRLSEGDERNPPAVYLFMTEKELVDPAAASGPAQLVNALAVRKGAANIELDLGAHPFHELMLECQAAAVIEARKETGEKSESASIWNRFGLHVPVEIEDAATALAVSLK